MARIDIDRAIDRLAALMPYGELQAATDPAAFLDGVAAELEVARPVVEAVGAWIAARPTNLTAPRLDAAYATYRKNKEGDDEC